MKKYEKKLFKDNSTPVASSSPINCQDKKETGQFSDCDSDPVLMRKLGIFLSDQKKIKTTTHKHPVLSHDIFTSEKTKPKPNHISPYSTLSDKGIGSSVGSFDVEFKNEPSIDPAIAARVGLPSRTGSLDSRTQSNNNNLKPVVSHARSSSEIIRSSDQSTSLTSLYDQAGAPMWNNDPRRNSFVEAVFPSSSFTNIIRSKKLSTKRQKIPNDISAIKAAEVKKLPQLFRLSPSTSKKPSASSSLSSLHLHEEEFDKRFEEKESKTIDSISPNSTLTESTMLENDFSGNCSVIVNSPTPPTPSVQPPPLPPKTTRLFRHGSEKLSQASVLNKNKDFLLIPSDQRQLETNNDHGTWTQQHRPRLFSEGALRKQFSASHQDIASEQKRNVSHVQYKSDDYTNLLNLSKQGGIYGGTQSLLFINRNRSGYRDSQNSIHNPNYYACQDNSSDLISMDLYRDSLRRSSTRSNPAFALHRPHLANIRPLHFELHQGITSENVFVGREWLFSEILNVLNNDSSKIYKGIIVHGKSGHGKTSVIQHLASNSYQGWSLPKHKVERSNIRRTSSNISRNSSPIVSRRNPPYGGGSCHSSRAPSPALSSASSYGSRAGSQVSLVDDNSRKVASQVVAVHFCQENESVTCRLPEFLCNVIARMLTAPQLTTYREHLLNDNRLKDLISLENCIVKPAKVLREAIIQPLVTLRNSQKFPKTNLIILVDGISTPLHPNPDYGYTITSFFQQHLNEFPEFLKLVATCDSDDISKFDQLPLHVVSLDAFDPNVERDMQLYINNRIFHSEVLSSFTLTGKPDTAVAQKQLSQHLIKQSQGNFLYLRLCLDLIDRGSIILKSSGFKVIPMNLHETCLLICNLNFQGYTSFNKLRDVLSVSLASPRSLNDEQLYHAVSYGAHHHEWSWDSFLQNMKLIAEILPLNHNTGTRSFFHPFYRKWFLAEVNKKKEYKQSSNRFQVCLSRGHALLATAISKQHPDLIHDQVTLELAHHVIESNMFKDHPYGGPGIAEQNVQMIANSSPTLTEALCSARNLLSPNMKIIRLLLQAGAEPNVNTTIINNATPLAVACSAGNIQLVKILLDYGAKVELLSSDGMSPLSQAASSGCLDIVILLLRYDPKPSIVDHYHLTPLLHAIKNDHANVAKLLLSRDLYLSSHHHRDAARRAIVTASAAGNVEVIEFVLELQDFQCDVDFVESFSGETPLTAAAAHGKANACEFLIRKYQASPHLRNKDGFTPLICAVKHDDWEVIVVLINCGSSVDAFDFGKKTPLIFAAINGNLGILQILLARGANPNCYDSEGFTPLCWAALKGHKNCVENLLHQSNVNHCDIHGRTALDLAIISGNTEIVNILIDAGCDIHHSDVTGLKPLNRAISKQDVNIVTNLLQYGAEVEQATWVMASGKTDIIVVILRHFTGVANSLYVKGFYHDAVDIYSNALKHVGELSPELKSVNHDEQVSDLCSRLLLGYSRSMRKMGNLDEGEKSIFRALELKPDWYEALYARSRIFREKGNLKSALLDVTRAQKNAPLHDMKEIIRLKEKIEEELSVEKGDNIRLSTSSDHCLPSDPHRKMSTHGNFSNISSSHNLPHQPLLSPSYKPLHSLPPPSYDASLQRIESQESLAESLTSLSVQTNNNSSNAFTPINPFLPPKNNKCLDLQRSHSCDNRYHVNAVQSIANNAPNNGTISSSNKPRKGFATDL